MPRFDEATIRKAASWQDFKEAQGLLNTGAVQESQETENGWTGSVRIGTRSYRVNVVARTPTWLDAKCPCPANSREGTFCPHSIAVGLHLLNPPVEKTTLPTAKSAETILPKIAWKIQLQGPWRKSIEKGRLSVAISPSDHDPVSTDVHLTAWLVSQKATSSGTIQLTLSSDTLPGFLEIILHHPEIHDQDGKLAIDSGIQLTLEDCTLNDGSVTLIPASQEFLKIGKSRWKISDHSFSKLLPPSPSIATLLEVLADGKPVCLPIERFLDQLDTLQSSINFSSSAWFESLQFIPATPEIKLSLSGSPAKVLAELFTSYSQSLPQMEGRLIHTKNSEAERIAIRDATVVLNKLSDSVTALTESPLKFAFSDSKNIQTLLTKTIHTFPGVWKTILSPKLEELAASFDFVSPRIRIIHSSERSIEFDLSYETDSGAVISATEIRRFLQTKRSFPTNNKQQQLILSDDIENLIEPLFQDLDLIQENGRFIAKNASAAIIGEISKKLCNSLIVNQLDFCKLKIQKLSLPPISATLRPYQYAGFEWIIDRLNRYQGALLADEMGLGKTLQTITCIEHLFANYPQTSPVLVLMTTSLLGNWAAEFQRFAATRKVIILHGSGRDKLRESITPDCVILTTYGTLARDLAWHLKQEYSLAVIDEASLIRNPDTDHSKAVAKLNAARRIALTGTPVENSARDLWSIFRFIQPGWLGTRKDFSERYEQALQSTETAAQASTLLRIKTSPFVLRRTKQEVAPELPSKIVIDEYCELSKDQSAIYRTLQIEGLGKIEATRGSGQIAAARMQTLTLLLRLRQACCDIALLDSEKLAKLPIPQRSGKLERLLEIIGQAISSGSRILVFSQFQKQLVEIENILTARAIASLRLDGTTRDRQTLVDHFQAPDGPPVFLISLKAGGYGLNLTAADVVIHFDPWWNPAAEAQATDRAHRIGQTKPVTVFRLLTRNSVEEKVVRLQSAKRALADSLDETTVPTDAPAWSEDELRRLLM